MKYPVVLMFALAAFQIPVGVAAAAPAAEEAATSHDDLSGYRLCPRCNTLNPPGADYCMRCGGALAAGTEEAEVPRPAVVKGFALTPFGFAGNHEAAGGGLRSRFDLRSWSYSTSYGYDARWPGGFYDSHQHHLLRNEGRFYFGAAAIRPFLGGALDAEYYHYEYHYYPGYERESDRYFVSAGFGGGLELNYDPRGSFFDIRGFAGPAVTWTGGDDDYSHTFAYFSFQVGNTTYFNRHVGLDIRLVANAETGYFAENRIILEIGPAFGW